MRKVDPAKKTDRLFPSLTTISSWNCFFEMGLFNRKKFFMFIKGWVPWTERTIPLDAVLKAPHETIIFMEG